MWVGKYLLFRIANVWIFGGVSDGYDIKMFFFIIVVIMDIFIVQNG